MGENVGKLYKVPILLLITYRSLIFSPNLGVAATTPRYYVAPPLSSDQIASTIVAPIMVDTSVSHPMKVMKHVKCVILDKNNYYSWPCSEGLI